MDDDRTGAVGVRMQAGNPEDQGGSEVSWSSVGGAWTKEEFPWVVVVVEDVPGRDVSDDSGRCPVRGYRSVPSTG